MTLPPAVASGEAAAEAPPREHMCAEVERIFPVAPPAEAVTTDLTAETV